MIGNDVIDLLDPDCRPGALHPRWDLRVLDEAEREALAACPDPDRMRWRFWAAKEAAFKAIRRLEPDLGFLRSKMSVTFVKADSGIVHCGASVLTFVIDEGEHHIHATALLGSGEDCAATSVIARREDLDESTAVRRLAAKELASSTGETGPWSIERGDDRIPRPSCRGERRDLAISLSHHGRFVACAFMRRPERPR